jgi:hypothetical protein
MTINIIELTYYECNKDSIFLATVITILMIIFTIIIKMICYTDYYTSINAAIPIYYYFGNKEAMRTKIYKILLERIEGFSDKSDGLKRIEEDSTVYYTVFDFMDYIRRYINRVKTIYLASIRSIVDTNENILKIYHDTRDSTIDGIDKFGEKISSDFSGIHS